MITTTKPIIFLAFANDRDDQARYLRNLAEEARQLQRILTAAEQHGHCELVLRQNVTAGDILDVFQVARYRNRIALFHFGGHANGYQLLLETAEGRPATADAGGLARFLAQQRGLQLVFLNGCSTEGQVSDLLDVGVHAVIATDQAVEDSMATDFAARFYGGLAGGAAIAGAFEEAKAALAMQGTSVFRHIGVAEDDLTAGRIPWHLQIRPGTEMIRDWSLPQAAGDSLFGLPQPPSFDLPDKPYRYLDWYRREDAEVFFGREREIRTLYDRVIAAGSPPIVLFYGQSGVGKSSLLAAGLLPRLESSHVVCYVRRDQTMGLTGTLAAALGAAPDTNLTAAWHTVERQTGRPLLVVLDQMEEVFTRSNPQQPDELARLLTELDSLFADAGCRPQGRLILSFRKEWLAEIDKHLAEHKLPRGEVFLERLGREGIAAVVAGPQKALRLTDHFRLNVADALPGLIADDLLADRESPVAPMLAILLADMWEAAKARSYDHPAFDVDLYHEFRSRGLSLDDFLGRQLQALGSKQTDVVASGLALDLLAYHTTALGTAEQRTLGDLEQIYWHRQDVLPALLWECRDLYLLVDPSQNQPDKPQASRLTHDTLAPHVRKRFDESDAPGQRARRILESRIPTMERDDPSENAQGLAPLGDADLDVVVAGQVGMRVWKRQEQELVAVSMTERTRRLEEQVRVGQEREQARQRELEQAHDLAEEQRLRAEEGERSARSLQRRLILAAAIGAIAIITAVAAFWFAGQAAQNAKIANNERQHTQANKLATGAQVELAQTIPDHSLALLLAMESTRVKPLGNGIELFSDSFSALVESVAVAPKYKLSLPPKLHAGGISSLVFSPWCLRPAPVEGQPCPRALLTASDDGTARLWDPETLEQLQQFVGHDGAVRRAQFSPDGNQVLTEGYDGTLRVWSIVEGGRQLQVLRPPDDQFLAIGFIPDGEGVVTIAVNGATRVWDITTGRETRQIPTAASATLAALSPDGTLLAVVTDRNATSVQVIEVTSGAVRRTLPVGQDIAGLRFSDDGEKIAVHSMAFSARGDQMWDKSTLWSVNDGRRFETVSPSDPTGGGLWLPDGTAVRFGDEFSDAEPPWNGITLLGFDTAMSPLTSNSDLASGFVATGGYYGEIFVWRLPITLPIASLGHADTLTALAFSGDDNQLLIGGLDGRLSLWNAITGKQTVALPRRAGDTWVTQVALSEDGFLAAAVTQGYGLGVWDTRSGLLLEGAKFRGSDDWPDLIHFVPGGPGRLNPDAGQPGLLVYGRDSKRVHLYNPRTDAIRHTFEGECEEPTRMAVSQDGDTLAMDCTGQGITVWQESANAPIVISTPNGKQIKAMHVASIEEALLVLDPDGVIWHWDPKQYWQRIGESGMSSDRSGAFSPDGSQLVVASRDGAVSLVDMLSGRLLQTWRHGSQGTTAVVVTVVAFSNDGHTVATAGHDGRTRLWDISAGARHLLAASEMPTLLPSHYCAMPSRADCRTMVALPRTRGILIWEMSQSQAAVVTQIPISRTLGVSPDGRYAVVRAIDNRLCAWATATAQEIGCLPAEQSPQTIRNMAIGGKEPMLAGQDQDGDALRVWRLPGFDIGVTVPAPDGVDSLAFSPSAPVLAVVGRNKQVTLWDVGGGEAKELHRLASPKGDISRLAFSPDGGALWIASGGPTSSVISHWRTDTWQESSFQRPSVDTQITALAVTPKGNRLAAGGADGMIYLWDATTGNELARLETDGVTGLDFNGDGRVLFSAGRQDRGVRIWPVNLRELMDQAKARISRDPPQFIGAEQRRYGLTEIIR